MLTKRDKEILKAINSYVNANGISPMVRNICDLVELRSSSTVHAYLNRLEIEGFITKMDIILRSIKITKKGVDIIEG
ncbi:transcriptional regulator [Alkaliphilus sp. MSJ-5]|uniref:Transcriptional regulator n=1 Tax=Alkaliphilus flagellatus TaxID=2841507 RepID=A0ABS6G537_9FIRM|nr:transcriptional regulator [Alkaliphilus flagellatus]MBU5677601.1 transcriptional regulator [Alkaliphilus flagellatus]